MVHIQTNVLNTYNYYLKPHYLHILSDAWNSVVEVEALDFLHMGVIALVLSYIQKKACTNSKTFSNIFSQSYTDGKDQNIVKQFLVRHA